MLMSELGQFLFDSRCNGLTGTLGSRALRHTIKRAGGIKGFVRRYPDLFELNDLSEGKTLACVRPALLLAELLLNTDPMETLDLQQLDVALSSDASTTRKAKAAARASRATRWFPCTRRSFDVTHAIFRRRIRGARGAVLHRLSPAASGVLRRHSGDGGGGKAVAGKAAKEGKKGALKGGGKLKVKTGKAGKVGAKAGSKAGGGVRILPSVDGPGLDLAVLVQLGVVTRVGEGGGEGGEGEGTGGGKGGKAGRGAGATGGKGGKVRGTGGKGHREEERLSWNVPRS